MRRLVVWISLAGFVTTHTTVPAGPHEEGTAAGQATNPTARGAVNAGSASTSVPGYTASPPERSYFGQPSLSGQANVRIGACAATPNDAVCQAQVGALTSANTARPAVSPYDPAVAGARDVALDPSSALGSLSTYYAGCTTAEVTTAAGTTNKVCHRYRGVGNYTTRRDLTVQVDLVPTCTEGEWISRGQVNRNDADYIVAEAQCRGRADGRQRFRFYAAGAEGACIGWQALDLPTAPMSQAAVVTDLSPHWSGYCWRPFKVVVMAGSGCTDGVCSYTFQFGTPVHACPAGTVRGDRFTVIRGGEDSSPGPADHCFTLSEPPPDDGCAAGTMTARDNSGLRCAAPAGPPMLVGATGWSMPMSFAQSAVDHRETDTWDDKSAALAPGGRCTVATAERCVEGPSIKTIDGRKIARACWAYERTLSCSGGAPVDECAPLVASGCTTSASACKQMNPVTGLCEVSQDTYRCPVATRTVTTAANCPANVFCLGSSCFNTSRTHNADFARSMSLMEAGREAGVYLDPDLMQVFKGEANSCRDRLLKNCCYTDGAGAGMTNQSLYGVGSRLVYDVLMNAQNREFIYQGMSALLTSGGFSGSYTTYGVTVAVNGTALPAGSAVLYAGDSLVVVYNPWSLAIAVVIYVVMSMMSCNDGEGTLAMKEGAGLCHSNGSYCSSCLRVFGACVACLEHTTGKCCFNSKLARIVNEQGRAQVAKGWGTAENPDCSGFTVAQLQALDFAAMDLSEFYASIVPTLPDVGALQTGSAARTSDCYYGQGRCQ